MLFRKCFPFRISFSVLVGLTAVLSLGLVLSTGCGHDHDHDNHDHDNHDHDNHDHDNHDHDNHGHSDAGWIEIETRGAASELIAVWDADEGWQDADGESISELPTPIDDDVDGLLPFTEEGDRASLTVRFFESDGSEVEMETLSRDDDTRERTCSEYSARYYPVDDDTEILYWGLMRHPDSDNGNAQFVEVDGEPTGIFHCDHVHIYPRNAGSVDVEFVLWHGDHGDASSDPLTVVVEAE